MSKSSALIFCKSNGFEIMPKTRPPTEFSYPIYPVNGSSQQLSNYCVHPNRPNVALRTEKFSHDLETWLRRNNVFSPKLFFVRNDLKGSQLSGYDEIPIQLHDTFPPQLGHPEAYYQVAVLSDNGFKLIKAIFKAVETLHSRPDYYRGDLSCVSSYVVREVFTWDSYRNSVLNIDVCLTPGHYDGDEFHRFGNNQKSDVYQLKKLLFETILKLPDISHFTNHEERVAGPRLPKSFEDLKLCFDTCQADQTLESKGWNTKAKGQFYHHYAIMDPVDRLMKINSLYDYNIKSHSDDSGNLKYISGDVVNWEPRIKKMKGSPLQKFYDEPFFDYAFHHPIQRPRFYSPDMRGLLKFLKHAFTHIREKSYATEFKNADYLELVVAEVFHGLYGNFF